MSRSRIAALGSFAALLLALGCGPTDVSYDPGYAHNAPPPGSGDRPEAPPWEHEDVIALGEAGMSIHLGDAPPALAGAYLTNSTEIYYDDLGHERDIADDYVFEFSAQTEDGAIRVSYSSEAARDSAQGLVGLITGEGDCFTVFVMNVQGVYDGCRYQTIFLYSGCVDGDGVLDWQNGVIMADKEGETCGVLMDVGHRRIIHEEDGLASAVVPSA